MQHLTARIARRSLLPVLMALFVLAALGPLQPATAQYPERPIKLVNPFAPGGTIDVIARIMIDKMGRELKQPLIMENRPGAAGVIAAAAVAKGPRDGYQIYFGTSATLGFAKLLNKDLPYDPARDFTPIVNLGSVPVAIFVSASSNIKTLQDLINTARAQPGKLSFGSPGIGSVSHLAAEMFKARTRIDMLHVPYTGAAARYWTDLIGGQIQVIFAGITGGLPLAKDGRVRLLATATRERSRLQPDVPAVGESIANYDAPAWFGLVVARGTPPEIVARLEAAGLAALRDPSTRGQFEAAGVDLGVIIDAKTFEAKIPADIALWEDALRDSGLIAK